MSINITAVGSSSGEHKFIRTNINSDENFIYYSNRKATINDTSVFIPSEIVEDAGYIYRDGAGSIGGLTTNTLYYANKLDGYRLDFSATEDDIGVPLDISSAGAVTLNDPIVYDNIINANTSYPNNQAVRYLTNDTPLDNLENNGVYFVKDVPADFAGASFRYPFSSQTFTTCGATGRVGPTFSQMQTTYGGTVWAGEYLRLGNFQGYQDWVVPVSGIYEIEAIGAAGRRGAGTNTAAGFGVRVKGRVFLNREEIITITVGQIGENSASGTTWTGSGGGTFVVRKEGNVPLMVAGGGSASANTANGRNGVTTTNGDRSGAVATPLAINGGGGDAAGGYSGGGGGFIGNGGEGLTPIRAHGGISFANGLSHVGTRGGNLSVGGFGGFGGAAMSDGNTAGQSGGAGGYSGGMGAKVTTAAIAGGGGGSFIISSATNVATSNGLYNGASTFNGVAITNLGSFNNAEGSVIVSLIAPATSGIKLYPTAVDSNNDTNAIAIEPTGSSYHALLPIGVNLETETIHRSTPHGYNNGEAIRYSFTGSPVGGLSSTNIYYAQVIDAFSFRISLTPFPDFTTINLTSAASSIENVISKVVVDTNLDILTINNHGFLVNQPIQYRTNGNNPIVPLQNLVTYYVKEVVDSNRIKISQSLGGPAIDFISPGTGSNHSFIFITVNDVEDSLYIPSHGLVSGQAIRYSNGGGTTIPGLVNNQIYYILRIDPNIVKLSINKALTNIANITGPGTGIQSLTITSVDLTTDTLTIPSHGFSTGELVNYDTRGQTEIGGLTSATPYYVIVVDGDNIKLALTPEDSEVGSAINLTSLGVGKHVLTSLSRTPDGTYVISSVPTSNTFTAQANGIVPEIVKIFTPRLAVNIQQNALNVNSHGFITGTKVTYNNNGGTSVLGLTNNQEYYVIVLNRDWIRLSTSAENALSSIPVVLQDFGVGADHTLTSSQISGNITGSGSVSTEVDSLLVNGSGTAFSKILKVGDNFRLFPSNITQVGTFASTGVNISTDVITSNTHGLTTGDSVKFSSGGGVPPAPLVEGYWYFINVLSTTTFTLHGTLEDALAGTNPVDLSTQGTGSSMTVTRIIPANPIIRKITAIGSDTQITVDRAYTVAYTDVSYSYPTFIYVRPEGYSLHRPFDGGVEMSVGSGTSFGQIIRQTRKYFRYQSGKGIQTSAGLNFKPSIDIDAAEAISPTTINIRTRRPHGLVSGLFVIISEALDSFGVSSSIYNGRFQVTVVDETNFTIIAQNPITENQAYGFPVFHVDEWRNGALRSGMFDSQNGMFFEFDGEKIYCVRRSSTQQIAGTLSALQGSEFVFGVDTKFTAQLVPGDFIVMRGQSYRVTEVVNDEQISIRPEYKGRSGTEREFDPAEVVNTSEDSFQLISHGYTQNLPIIYNSIDGIPIGGLINGRTYYVDIIDSNNFKLKGSIEAEINVDITNVGAGSLHSFVPAKTGIIATLTVDVKVPQEEWTIDPCDGTGVTGYNLNLSKIQMIYIDYSWYGAGKIRFGFKTISGEVQYVHEFIHNNFLNESYFRSGNLPARYEVATFENPTYIPFLFHWGTSVIMDGRFDDDRAYLFTASSQSLNVGGTTPKSFGSSQINILSDIITIPSHGFVTGDKIQFIALGTNGLPTQNTNNPRTQVVTGGNQLANLTNEESYFIRVFNPNQLTLYPTLATATANPIPVINRSRSNLVVTITTGVVHGFTTGQSVLINGLNDSRFDGSYIITSTPTTTTFTYNSTTSGTVGAQTVNGTASLFALNYQSQGQSQDTFYLYPDGTLNNTSGANYQPLLSLRLSPSVSEGLTGQLGERDVINRMQLRLRELGVQTNQLVDVKLLLNARLNNLSFRPVASPSLVQIVEHTASDTVSGGIQVYNFKASGQSGQEQSTTIDISELFELSNSILGGDSVFPDGPDIVTIAVARLTGTETTTSARLSWTEAQA
jgi:hypothetical protein